MKHQRLPGMEDFIPPEPTRLTPYVAREIAARIVACLNTEEELYWLEEEAGFRVLEMQCAIQAGAKPDGDLLGVLRKMFGEPWSFLDENERGYVRSIAERIAKEEEETAKADWREKYFREAK